MTEKMLRPREACKILGINYSTLIKWIRRGYIRAVRTAGGRYRIPESEIGRILGIRGGESRAVIYARVSSDVRAEYLDKQVKKLLDYCNSKGYKIVDVIRDISPGVSEERVGLRKLLEMAFLKHFDVVVVESRERLAMIGAGFLEQILSYLGIRVEVLSEEDPEGLHQEIVEDLMRIIEIFARKIYGPRTRKSKDLIEGFRVLLEVVERGEAPWGKRKIHSDLDTD